MSSQSNLVVGDIAVVLRNNTGAHKVKDAEQFITPGEKIKIMKVDAPHNVVYYPTPTSPNSIYLQDVEKIYYNDSFKLAWNSFGEFVKPPQVDD